MLSSIVQETIRANDLEAKSLRVFPDLESDWFLDGELHFGCEITYANGGKRRTTGYLNGNIPWNQLQVESEQAAAFGDLLLVDLFKVRNNKQTLVIKVKLRNAPHVQTIFDLKEPPMESISIFLANTTSLRNGKKIKPSIVIQWANQFQLNYSLCDRRSIIPFDSVHIFLNQERMFDCQFKLPEQRESVDQTFSISVMWGSKPWMSDTKVYAYSRPRRLSISTFRNPRKRH
jgi:hypothetical protein